MTRRTSSAKRPWLNGLRALWSPGMILAGTRSRSVTSFPLGRLGSSHSPKQLIDGCPAMVLQRLLAHPYWTWSSVAVPSGDPDEWTGSAVGSCISVKFLPDRHFPLWTGRAASRATAYRYPPWNPNNNSTPLEEVRTAPLTFSAARVNRPDGSDGAPSRTLLPVHESGIPGICGLHMPLPRSERERGKGVPRLKALRDGERKGSVVLVASAAELVP